MTVLWSVHQIPTLFLVHDGTLHDCFENAAQNPVQGYPLVGIMVSTAVCVLILVKDITDTMTRNPVLGYPLLTQLLGLR